MIYAPGGGKGDQKFGVTFPTLLASPPQSWVAPFSFLARHPTTSHIPIVAMTAAAEKFSKDEALAAGCDAYILKPVDTRKLPQQIVSAAARKGRPPEKECIP